MKSMIKKQWTQITAVIAAAACAVTATVAGVSGSFSAPINAYAMDSGTEISMTLTKNSEPDETTGEYGYHYVLDLSQTTQEDVGKTVYISCVAPKMADQLLKGAFGYADPTDGYNWKQDEWKTNADSEGKYTVSFEIAEGMAGHKEIQFQCWYPSTYDIESCVAVFDQAPGSEVTTTTEETTTTTEVTNTTEETPDTTTTTTEVVDGTTTTEETTTTETTTTETTTTTTTTTTVTTTTAALDFKNITIGASNKTPVTNKCCLFVTMKADPGTRLSGAVYYGNPLVTQTFDGTTDADGYLRVAFKINKGIQECDFQIQQGSGSVKANFTSYYWGDASLNGKVNGSDVRAIINYIKSQTKSEHMEIVCDYNDDNSVGAADAVALTKALLSLAPPSGTAY